MQIIVTGSTLRKFTRNVCAILVGVLFFLVDYYGGKEIPLIGGRHIQIWVFRLPFTLILCIVLLAANQMLTFFEEKYRNNVVERIEQLHNFCIRLFDKHFKEWEEILGDPNSFRISIFEIKTEGILKRKVLKFLTRYQSGESTNPEINFKVGEGAAGMACETRSVILKQSLPNFQENRQQYLQKMKECYNLTEDKTLKLNRKASSYVCVPMLSLQPGSKAKAIMCIDAIKSGMFYENTDFSNKTLPAIIHDVDMFSSGFFS